MQPVSEAKPPVGEPQSKVQEPVQGRGRGFGSILGKVGNTFGIEVKPVSVGSEPVRPSPIPEPVKNAFEGAPDGVTDPTVPAPLEPDITSPTNPSEISLQKKEDPGIPMDAVKVEEDPGVTVQPEVVSVQTQPEVHEEPVKAEVHAEQGVENEVKVPISFLEKWLLKHTLPDYVKGDGSIDDDKLERNAKDPAVLREAGMSDEIVTLVGAVEDRGIEIDEVVEAGIEQVWKRSNNAA